MLPVMLGMGGADAAAEPDRRRRRAGAQVSDPAEWLRVVGGPAYAIVSLTFVTAANFGTTMTGIYASAIGLRNFAALEQRTWSTLLLITIAPVALVGMFIPELFFARFGNFLALLGVGFAPLCGIQIVDYFSCAADASTFGPFMWMHRGRLLLLAGHQSGGDGRARGGLHHLHGASQSADL